MGSGQASAPTPKCLYEDLYLRKLGELQCSKLTENNQLKSAISLFYSQ